MYRKITSLEWKVGDCGVQRSAPPEMIKASVPGNIQLDFAESCGYKDLNIADNYKQFGWMDDHYFIYEAFLPEKNAGERMILSALGIDYEFEILINDESVYHYEGMFAKTELDITRYLKGGDKLGVLIYPIPRVEDAVLERDNVRQSCKPGVGYGWDFHPHLVPSGIWDEIGIIITDEGYISDWNMDYELSDDYKTAFGKFELIADCGGDEFGVALCITDPCGGTVFEASSDKSEIEFSIVSPKLWWPNGYGEPLLYGFTASLLKNGRVIDSVSFKRGFRKLELVPYEGSWNLPVPFPTPAYPQPLTYKINGRAIFVQGTNWVCPKIFYGTLTKEDYDIQLSAVRAANMNYVRCWGGAIVNKEAFFELCDEYGILVWQEFPLACNCYFDSPHYLDVLDKESRAVINRVKKHTCLALWVCGNELFTPWSGMTTQSGAIRLIDHNCYELDKKTPFIPSSPLYEMMHGDYRFRDSNGRDIIQLMNESSCTGYNEIGCAGAGDMETIKYVIPENELDEIKPGTSWEIHHAVNAWMKDSHLYPGLIKYYFGSDLTLEQIIDYSRMLQGIGYQYVYEEARRQAPRCSMVLNWCFNEPWPTVANNSIIAYNNKLKPAYYNICNALRPSMPSLRYEKFEFFKGEKLKLDAWWLAQNPASVCGELKITALIDGIEKLLCEYTVSEEKLESNKQLTSCECVLDSESTQLIPFSAVFTSDNGSVIRSDYKILYKAERK